VTPTTPAHLPASLILLSIHILTCLTSLLPLPVLSTLSQLSTFLEPRTLFTYIHLFALPLPFARTMGLLCCGDDDGKSKTLIPTPSRVAPKLVRRRSVPRPRASKQNIEKFYREGRELLRAEREQWSVGMRAPAGQQHADDAMIYDDDATEIRGPVEFGEMREYDRNGARTVAADSMFRTMHNQYFHPPSLYILSKRGERGLTIVLAGGTPSRRQRIGEA